MGKKTAKRTNYKTRFLELQEELQDTTEKLIKAEEDAKGEKAINQALKNKIERRSLNEAIVNQVESKMKNIDSDFGKAMTQAGHTSERMVVEKTTTVEENLGETVETMDQIASAIVIFDKHIENVNKKMKDRLNQMRNINKALSDHV